MTKKIINGNGIVGITAIAKDYNPLLHDSVLKESGYKVKNVKNHGIIHEIVPSNPFKYSTELNIITNYHFSPEKITMVQGFGTNKQYLDNKVNEILKIIGEIHDDGFLKKGYLDLMMLFEIMKRGGEIAKVKNDAMMLIKKIGERK